MKLAASNIASRSPISFPLLCLIFQAHHKEFYRQRVIFFAHPVDERQMPKTIPDYESVGT
jgi:hypothetical protein